MKIELTRFKLKQDKSDKADEWMNMLRENLPAVLETLDNEKMYVEAIFREKTNDQDYLYWFSIRGEGGARVEDSKHEIDKKHLEYFRECVDVKSPDYKTNIPLEIFMKSEKVQI